MNQTEQLAFQYHKDHYCQCSFIEIMDVFGTDWFRPLFSSCQSALCLTEFV
jgi:hypothetical protein